MGKTFIQTSAARNAEARVIEAPVTGISLIACQDEELREVKRRYRYCQLLMRITRIYGPARGVRIVQISVCCRVEIPNFKNLRGCSLRRHISRGRTSSAPISWPAWIDEQSINRARQWYKNISMLFLFPVIIRWCIMLRLVFNNQKLPYKTIA